MKEILVYLKYAGKKNTAEKKEGNQNGKITENDN